MAGPNLGAADRFPRTQSLNDGILRTEELDDGIDRNFDAATLPIPDVQETGTFLDFKGRPAGSAVPGSGLNNAETDAWIDANGNLDPDADDAWPVDGDTPVPAKD